MMIPTIHLNGTSRDELCRQLEDAAHALQHALRALSETAPNGRDYYPQGPDAIKQATTEHQSRTQRVHDVYMELQWMREALEDT